MNFLPLDWFVEDDAAPVDCSRKFSEAAGSIPYQRN